jgi:raffinose/stachyose/melibiose transport system substrate-binding protein
MSSCVRLAGGLLPQVSDRRVNVRFVELRLPAAWLTATLLLAGCSIGGQPSSTGGTLTIWSSFTGDQGQGFPDIIAAWQQQNPGWTIQHRAVTNEQKYAAVRTGVAGANPPDVMEFSGYKDTQDFAKAGQIVDISDWYNTIKGNIALPDVASAACSYQGKWYCLPYAFQSGSSLFYNSDLLQAHGIAVPTTYDDFLGAGDKLKSAGVLPVSLGSKAGWPATQWHLNFLVQRCGADTINAANSLSGAKWTDPCFVQSAQDLANLAHRGFFGNTVASEDYPTMTSVWLAGKAGFIQTGSWLSETWTKSPPSFKAGAEAFPPVDGAQYTNQVIGGYIYDFAIPSRAKNRDMALNFLKFLASPAAAKVWAAAGNFASIKGINEQYEPASRQDLWKAINAAPKSIVFIDNTLPPAVAFDTYYNGATAVAAGTLSPQAWCSEMQQALVKAGGG